MMQQPSRNQPIMSLLRNVIFSKSGPLNEVEVCSKTGNCILRLRSESD